MGDLNLFQQICVQIFTVNLAGTLVGSEKFLQGAMNLASNFAMEKWLSKYGWKITWGPRVFKSSESSSIAGLDNCWMISMCPDIVHPDGVKCDTYVVAIAGTAVLSKTDWVMEDFGVDNVVSFNDLIKDEKFIEPLKLPTPIDNPPYCAWGTAWGAYQVVTHTSPDGNPGEKTTILEYLAGINKDKGNFRIVFAGHSLGGALAPFLSLVAKFNKLIPGLRDRPENILTFPAAGASPGDGPLRDAYNELFPVGGPGGYQLWNADFYNTLDIVPQAWSTDQHNDRFLDKIVTIYGDLGPLTRLIIQKMVDAAKKRASGSGITYEPIKGNAFTGSPPDHPPINLISFILEAAKQHTKAYHDHIGVGNILSELYSVAASTDGVDKKTVRQVAKSLPVVSLAADEIEHGPEGVPQGVEAGVSEVHPYDCILNDG